MRAFKGGGFGAGQRLSATGFVLAGLLTFWVYSILRMHAVLRTHLDRRWDAFGAPGVAEALRQRGFVASRGMPYAAAALFAGSALMVATWFMRWIVLGESWQYGQIVGFISVSAALFYVATALAMLWTLGTLRRHEAAEFLLREAGPGAGAQAPEMSDELVLRWERESSQVILFLVVALPIVFSPAIGAHLYLGGTVWGHELVLPALCFGLAVVFHVWGTTLLVGLYNRHLAAEARHVAAPEVHPAAALAQPPSDGDAPTRELMAIMLTDMYGYSKAMERDEARAYATLVEHNGIMRAAIAAHRGREIKTIGDAFLVVFRSALDAVDCALTAQKSFADFNLGRPEGDKVLVRIGIHLGDVLVAGNDVFGDGVNVAARIEPHAEPGGICISEPVFEMVRKKLQIEVTRLEGAKLKNIAVAPDLYRIRLGP